jgi:hypothetical protein
MKKKFIIKTPKEYINYIKNLYWHSEDNKNLLFLIEEKRLKLAPATLKKLDSFKFNYIEIINLSALVLKNIMLLQSSDIDFLNYLEKKYNICFNHFDKISNKTNIILNKINYGYCQKTKRYNGSCGLFLEEIN